MTHQCTLCGKEFNQEAFHISKSITGLEAQKDGKNQWRSFFHEIVFRFCSEECFQKKLVEFQKELLRENLFPLSLKNQNQSSRCGKCDKKMDFSRFHGEYAYWELDEEGPVRGETIAFICMDDFNISEAVAAENQLELPNDDSIGN